MQLLACQHLENYREEVLQAVGSRRSEVAGAFEDAKQAFGHWPPADLGRPKGVEGKKGAGKYGRETESMGRKGLKKGYW